MDFAEIEKFINTPVKRYSNGMYVPLALWNRPLLQSLSWNMTYSTGLAFAVAAHLEPEILLVDEVLALWNRSSLQSLSWNMTYSTGLAVGDAAFQKNCLGKMGDVASKGRTVLFVES